jgi:sugar (pentulose or hexulose) kinase
MATSGRWGRWRGPRRAPRTSTTSSGLCSRKTEVAEAGALGPAICAGIGTGVYFSLDGAIEQIVRVLRTHEPDPQSRDRLGEAYEA